jgi:hypothetical protein
VPAHDALIRAKTSETAPEQFENLGSSASLDDGDACGDKTFSSMDVRVAVFTVVRAAWTTSQSRENHGFRSTGLKRSQSLGLQRFTSVAFALGIVYGSEWRPR